MDILGELGVNDLVYFNSVTCRSCKGCFSLKMLTELWRIVMFNYNMLFCLSFRRSNSDGYIRSPIFDDTARFLKKLEKMSALARAARNLRGYGRYYQAK